MSAATSLKNQEVCAKEHLLRTLPYPALPEERLPLEKGRADAGRVQLDWFPIQPNAVSGFINNLAVHDDGQGNLRARHNKTIIGSIDYQAGIIRLNDTHNQRFVLQTYKQRIPSGNAIIYYTPTKLSSIACSAQTAGTLLLPAHQS